MIQNWSLPDYPGELTALACITRRWGINNENNQNFHLIAFNPGKLNFIYKNDTDLDFHTFAYF